MQLPRQINATGHFTLKNVRLETGFEYDDKEVIRTKTDLFSEFDLSRTLQFATQNTLPLDDNGNRQWPKAGDDANAVLTDASCSAEAVSRIAKVNALIS